MKIFVTGDTHIPIDIHKLNNKRFPEQKELTKEDYVIICGDFGGVWNESKEEFYWRDWINKKNYTTLFIDGNHENHFLLSQYEVQQWNGGKVHFISDNIIHLMRGQVYEIGGLKFFTMGGAHSTDIMRRKEGISWWKEELPSFSEYEEAMTNLDRHDWKVDYILTHSPSQKMIWEMGYHYEQQNSLTAFLDEVRDKVSFNHWYFGHMHEDRKLDNNVTALFQDIMQIC